MNDNYYTILDCNKQSTYVEIKKAYKIKAKEHHPDLGGDSKIFKKIKIAYDVLKDKEKRKLYDDGCWISEETQNEIIDIYANILLPEMVDNINAGVNMNEIISYFIKQEQNKYKDSLSQLKWSKDSIEEIISQTTETKENTIANKVKDNFIKQKEELESQIIEIEKKISILNSALSISKNLFK